MSRVPDIEYSALQMLVEGEARLAESGTMIWLAGLNPGVLKVVENPAWPSASAVNGCCSMPISRSSAIWRKCPANPSTMTSRCK